MKYARMLCACYFNIPFGSHTEELLRMTTTTIKMFLVSVVAAQNSGVTYKSARKLYAPCSVDLWIAFLYEKLRDTQRFL